MNYLNLSLSEISRTVSLDPLSLTSFNQYSFYIKALLFKQQRSIRLIMGIILGSIYSTMQQFIQQLMAKGIQEDFVNENLKITQFQITF